MLSSWAWKRFDMDRGSWLQEHNIPGAHVKNRDAAVERGDGAAVGHDCVALSLVADHGQGWVLRG